ncbi:hypothetical protein ABZP36_013506 [Zizania latifolia]
MSCFPCFGGGKKKNAQADKGQDEDPPQASQMTPPPAVSAPVHTTTAAAPAPMTPPNGRLENHAHKPSTEDGSLQLAIAGQAFAFRELAAATDHFTPYNLVGEGGFFRVYKGQLEKTGQTVAIKQLDRHGFQGNNEFLTEVSKLSRLHHENIVDIIGYCADGDQRLLVYEFISAGTLEDHLKPVEEQNVVTWAMPMFKDQKRYHELVDPLIKSEYQAKALNQVVAMAAMCLQEEDSVRPLMADVVMTLGFLTALPPDPPAASVPAPVTSAAPKQEKRSDHSDSSSSSSDDDGDEEEEDEDEEEQE